MIVFRRQKKTQPQRRLGFFGIRAWRFPTFAWQIATLSSALSGFTSEFGMGSGGPRSLWSPGKLVQSRGSARLSGSGSFGLELLPFGWLRLRPAWKSVHFTFRSLASCERRLFDNTLGFKPIGCYMVKPHGQLVSVSFIHYCTSTPDLST